MVKMVWKKVQGIECPHCHYFWVPKWDDVEDKLPRVCANPKCHRILEPSRRMRV